ncbi:unnamed protein product [[Candida] boidinii]|nr:unnamed protein product [[Candida] boidinii]
MASNINRQNGSNSGPRSRSSSTNKQFSAKRISSVPTSFLRQTSANQGKRQSSGSTYSSSQFLTPLDDIANLPGELKPIVTLIHAQRARVYCELELEAQTNSNDSFELLNDSVLKSQRSHSLHTSNNFSPPPGFHNHTNSINSSNQNPQHLLSITSNNLSSDQSQSATFFTRVTLRLSGTELAIWKLDNDGNILDDKLDANTFKPVYINISDAQFIYPNIKAKDRKSIDFNSSLILKIKLTNSKSYNLKLKDENDLNYLYSNLLLSQFEYKQLQESFTGALLSAKAIYFSDVRVILASNNKHLKEEWCVLRFPFLNNKWIRCYVVVHPAQAVSNFSSKKKKLINAQSTGKIEVYLNENKKKKHLLATIRDVKNCSSIYPESPVHIDTNSLIRVFGHCFINENLLNRILSIDNEEGNRIPSSGSFTNSISRKISSNSLYSQKLKSAQMGQSNSSHSRSNSLTKLAKAPIARSGSRTSLDSLASNFSLSNGYYQSLNMTSNNNNNNNGSMTSNSNEGGTRSRSLSIRSTPDIRVVKTQLCYIIPETHQGVEPAETMIRLLIPIMNSFKLYGRPTKFLSTRDDRNSLLFGLPQLPHTQYLNIEDSFNLVSLNIPNSVTEKWSTYDWTQVFKEMVHLKLSEGSLGFGSLFDSFKDGLLYTREKQQYAYEDFDDNYDFDDFDEIVDNENLNSTEHSSNRSSFINTNNNSNNNNVGSPNVRLSSNRLPNNSATDSNIFYDAPEPPASSHSPIVKGSTNSSSNDKLYNQKTNFQFGDSTTLSLASTDSGNFQKIGDSDSNIASGNRVTSDNSFTKNFISVGHDGSHNANTNPMKEGHHNVYGVGIGVNSPAIGNAQPAVSSNLRNESNNNISLQSSSYSDDIDETTANPFMVSNGNRVTGSPSNVSSPKYQQRQEQQQQQGSFEKSNLRSNNSSSRLNIARSKSSSNYESSDTNINNSNRNRNTPPASATPPPTAAGAAANHVSSTSKVSDSPSKGSRHQYRNLLPSEVQSVEA